MTNYNSGLTSVTGNVTTTVQTLGLASPTATQTVVQIIMTNLTDQANLITVPVGKTFYCMGVSLGSGTGSGWVALKVGAAIKFNLLQTANISYCCPSGSSPLFTCAATEQLDLDSTGSSSVYGNIWGFYQ